MMRIIAPIAIDGLRMLAKIGNAPIVETDRRGQSDETQKEKTQAASAVLGRRCGENPYSQETRRTNGIGTLKMRKIYNQRFALDCCPWRCYYSER